MDYSEISEKISSVIHRYRVNLFVFLIALFIGLSLAHPAVLLNDEFITTNQLHQLHAGHQVVINEGKYGLIQNGSMGSYFRYKANVLGYSLFLPLISLPAHWMIDFTGENYVYYILCLWTIIALLIILFISHFFKDFSYIGSRKWTPYAFTLVFLVFFFNLFNYAVFDVDSFNTYPEVLAIVTTNIFLVAISSVLIYEINRTVFDHQTFAFFGTIVCLFSSSYFFWATHCKDHILVLPLFCGVFLGLLCFIKKDEYWYLPLAFLFTGLLAWARPEIALWISLVVFGIWIISLFQYYRENRSLNYLVSFFCTPIFMLIGALPFFLNNYMINKNILLPTQTLYLSEGLSYGVNNTQSLSNGGLTSLPMIILKFAPTTFPRPSDFIGDLAGVFLSPQTGNVGFFALIPLFLVMSILGCILLFFKKISFSAEEKKSIYLTIALSVVVFFTYASQLHSLNTDLGITPDIRYLSPMYLPLTIIGLIILQKSGILKEKPTESIKKVLIICLIGIPISVILLYFTYPSYEDIINFGLPFGRFFSYYVLSLVMITFGTLLYSRYTSSGREVTNYLILLLCTIPFFWQVNETFVIRMTSGFSGYTFWIPIVRIFWEVAMVIITAK